MMDIFIAMLAMVVGFSLGFAIAIETIRPKTIRYEPWLKEDLILAPLFSGDFSPIKVSDEIIKKYQNKYTTLIEEMDNEVRK